MTSREQVRFADHTAFIVLKALAFDSRGENNDAGDLVHVTRYGGKPEEVAGQIVSRFQTGLHCQAVQEALAALELRFLDGGAVDRHLLNGPVAAARFRYDDDSDVADDRILEQLNVATLVGDIVGRVRALIA